MARCSTQVGEAAIRLFLNLLGTERVRRRWPVLAAIGACWAGLGAFIFLDALDNSMVIPVWGLGTLVLAEGGLSLLAGLGSAGPARRLRLAKGVGLLLVGVLSIEATGAAGDVALALLIGVAFTADGALKIAAARVVRFRGWRWAQAKGALSLVLALSTLQPWPTWYVGTIGCNVGIALFLSGLGALELARRLRAGPAGAVAAPDRPGGGPAGTLIVHVWTPAGTVDPADRGPSPATRALIERYIAAVDRKGTVSTGHVALELAPDVYISHYPATEIDRSPGSFGRILRATADNDAPGQFKPDYAAEAAGWCPATFQVRFTRFDAARLRAFWAAYRQDDTYNLTSRNCSSAVAAALDAALEGALHAPAAPWRITVRAAWSPELWAATMLRRRAETMAWTPGLMLDYAGALAAVLDPPALPWSGVLRRGARRIRRARRVLNARRTRTGG